MIMEVKPDVVIPEVAPPTQRELDIKSFFKEYNMTGPNNKTKRLLMESSFTSFEAYKLRVRISNCCKDMDMELAFEYYCHAIDLGVTPLHVTYQCLLSLVAGLGEQGSGNGPIRTTVPPSNFKYAERVYNDMKEAKFPMNEPIYSAMIRCSCLHHQPDKALELYRDLQKDNTTRKVDEQITPKLRTFSHLLTAFANNGDDTTAYMLLDEMTDLWRIALSENEWVTLLHLAATKQDSARFYSLFHTMREEIRIPTCFTYAEDGMSVEFDVWVVMRRWFASHAQQQLGYQVITSDIAENGDVLLIPGERIQCIDLTEEKRQELLAQLDEFAVKRDEANANKPPKMYNNKIKDLYSFKAGRLKAPEPVSSIVEGVGVEVVVAEGSNNTTASISDGNDATSVVNEIATAAATSSSSSSSAESTSDSVTTEDIASAAKKRAHSSKPENDPVFRREQWDKFKAWLDARLDPFDVLVDGANVGYYKQNYANAPNHIDHAQVDHMLRQLQQLGHKPLLVLHSRHLMQNMVPDDEAKALMASWDSEGLMYTTPKSFNDDWFWMYAAVKTNCKVVTNDEMRDHHFQLLHPRWFCRWKECHQVHYSFSYWGKRKNTDDKGPKAVMTNTNTNSCDVSTTEAENNVEKVVSKEEESQPALRHQHQYSRAIDFAWPCLYSFCIQHIVSEHYEGFYCPPVLMDESEEVDEGEVVDEKNPAVENETKWLCCVRPISGVKQHSVEVLEDVETGDRKRQKVDHHK